ncbi:26S proteasome non-ATPase regulatory subunit 5 [Drosophila eugracilis]|uniref:26S proteasome non-ATPase regulatory subunit 5 n=1 Tax=Drosophila eugracilis TaxID=29029 RepID=UPI0007E684BA|nr:26S proteasome non-ATPase regulatory subunit 5 [Drosophila eugracilis]
MEESWWVANIKALESRPQRLEALTKMNTAIGKETALPRQIIGRLMTTAELYDCANPEVDSQTPKDQAVDVALELLGHCIDQLAVDTADEQLPSLLGRGLAHPNPALRSLVLASVLKELRRQLNAGQVHTLPGNELLFLILDELKQPETDSSSLAINILSIVLVQRLSDAGVQAKLVQLLQQNEIVRCRTYELAVVLAKGSATSLSAVEFILDAALSELDNDDVLLQATVLEILVPLAEQNHGLSFMERRRVFDVISTRVQRIEENPLDALLIPSIMKFFGKIAAVQPQKIIVGYPHMLACLFQQLQSEDETILPTAMDTLANLASTPQGKMLLHLHFNLAMEQSFKKYGSYTKKLSALIKERLLNSLDVIYATETPPTKEINSILKTWYESFAGGAQANVIMDLINTPFPDLQLAALALLKTVCKYAWGIVALKNTGGAVEFLLSRQKDLHKDVKFLKWEIMEMLSVSAEFSPTETVRFSAYVNEGPYHIQADVNIATEPQGNA